MLSEQLGTQIVGIGENNALYTNSLGGLDVGRVVVDKSGLCCINAEAVESKVEYSGIGFYQMNIGRDDIVVYHL